MKCTQVIGDPVTCLTWCLARAQCGACLRTIRTLNPLSLGQAPRWPSLLPNAFTGPMLVTDIEPAKRPCCMFCEQHSLPMAPCNSDNKFKLCAGRYPGRKEENWWLMIGQDNSCLVIKRVPLKQKATSKLQFTAPDTLGQQELSLYFMCDSWNGCDQVTCILHTLTD